ncbi:MAG: FAD-binding protein [Nocardioides sp.]|jgi:FAD-linked oxidoreductase|uniref:D-arabinono-1,4-lactone oxidase n=1 Tax=Nocardioides sp. TaxID=35761 RepID=UPI002637FEB9|nr:D-arabinono-1,4-lactone oxidase [Nocardioides sp.]MCW2835354.1 FAD-binding protein [Nocardioides sp.]
MAPWTNWAGTETAAPERVVAPHHVREIVDEIERSRARGRTLKMTGTGHSFTGISAPVDTMVRPDHFTGIVAVDRDAMTVTVRAGTPLHVLNQQLTGLGLSLHNMGDIAEQTLAGATSTGTHGTGGTVASLSAQIEGFTIISGQGEEITASRVDSSDVFAVGRVGLGALGILTELTVKVEPLFALEAHEQPMTWDTALATYDELTADHDHVDVYWFPHTEHALAKVNDRRTDLDDIRPLSRWRHWLDDELLSNTLFGMITSLGTSAPAAVPVLNRLSGRALSERTFSDVAHRVFTSSRRVRFKEMEYAVPREVGVEALREVRRVIDASTWRIGFPIEVRTTPADDIALSTASGRESMYLAFHVPVGADHTDYFTGVEDVLRHFEGRPHWGKMHTRGADELSSLYPRFGEFLAVRDALDPDRVFTNPYLRSVLGD